MPLSDSFARNVDVIDGRETDFDRREPHRQYDRLAQSLPRVDHVGPEYDVVAFGGESYLRLRSVKVEGHAQGARH